MNKKIGLHLPEYLLIASVLFYWVSTANIFNPIAIGLLIFLIFQLVFKIRWVGLAIPSVLIMASLFMLLALISEVSEFPSFTPEAQKLLFIGLTWILGTMAASSIMIYKYATLQPKRV